MFLCSCYRYSLFLRENYRGEFFSNIFMVIFRIEFFRCSRVYFPVQNRSITKTIKTIEYAWRDGERKFGTNERFSRKPTTFPRNRLHNRHV